MSLQNYVMLCIILCISSFQISTWLVYNQTEETKLCIFKKLSYNLATFRSREGSAEGQDVALCFGAVSVPLCPQPSVRSHLLPGWIVPSPHRQPPSALLLPQRNMHRNAAADAWTPSTAGRFPLERFQGQLGEKKPKTETPALSYTWMRIPE